MVFYERVKRGRKSTVCVRVAYRPNNDAEIHAPPNFSTANRKAKKNTTRPLTAKAFFIRKTVLRF